MISSREIGVNLTCSIPNLNADAFPVDFLDFLLILDSNRRYREVKRSVYPSVVVKFVVNLSSVNLMRRLDFPTPKLLRMEGLL